MKKTGIAKAAGLTHVGLQRERNEDSFSTDDLLGLYVVADGMGGHSAGDVASKVAVDLVNRCFKNWSDTRTSEEAIFGSLDPSLSKTGNYVLSSIRLANRVIHEMSGFREQYRGMGTTIAVLAVTPGGVISANVGDSRVYMIRDGQIETLSRDHTLVAEQVEMGLMTPEEARQSSLKHVLTKSLGSSEEVVVDVFEIESKKRDRFVLCTDGITDLISDREILRIVQEENELDALCKEFLHTALQRGASDNLTVVTVYL